MIPRLAFVCQGQNRYYQDVLQGIVEGLAENPLFHLQAWMGSHVIAPAALQYLTVDAVVTTNWEWEGLPQLPRSTPVIGISNAKAESDFPRIINDDLAVGRMSAEALMDAGYERLLVLKSLNHHHVQQRCQGVAEVAKQHALPLHIEEISLRRPLPGETFGDVLRDYRHALADVVRPLLPGTGVLDVQSNVGPEFLEVVHELSRLRVPEDIGLLTMDSTPPDETRMACIELNGREIGRQALRALHQQVQGGTPRPPGSCVAVPPLGIRFGQSLRQGEGVLLHQQLLHFFQAHLDEEIQVENVARTLGHSRRSLEMKLKAAKLPAPYELLTRLRLKRAEDLLGGGEMSIEEIAQRSGFANARSLGERFRAYHGITPFAFRKRSRTTIEM